MATLVYSDVDGVDRSFALGGEPVMVGRGRRSARSAARIRASRACTRGSSSSRARCGSRISAARTASTSGRTRSQRAPVPTGEIILVGSLMIRLLPRERHAAAADRACTARSRRGSIWSARRAPPSRTSATRSRRRVGELHEEIAAKPRDRLVGRHRCPGSPPPTRCGCATRPRRAPRRSSERSRRCRTS